MRKPFYFLSVLLPLVACTALKEEVETMPLGDGSQMGTKVLCLGENYDPSTVLVKLSSADDFSALDAIRSKGVADVQKLFPSMPGKEALEAEYGLDRWYEVTLSEGQELSSLSSDLSELESVSLIQYNTYATHETDGQAYFQNLVQPTKASTESDFNDPYLSYQWDFCNTGSAAYAKNAVAGADVNVKDVWATLCTGDPSIIVAVVDEGVKYTHPDLAANMWVNSKEIAGNGIDDDGNGYVDDVYGYNFVDKGQISWTKSGDSGHATHCAGSIAAVNNNGTGICGIAGGSGNGDGCRIMSCQIFSGNYGGTTSISSKAIKYAADMGASIISCSFGYTTSFKSDNDYIKSQGSAEVDAIKYFEASKNNTVLDGGIAVFAAGNETHDYAHYPGAFVDIISVSAFAADFLPTYYTNYGPGCNIAAPGGELGLCSDFGSMILSTMPSEISDNMTLGGYEKSSDYGYMQGTSMACPHASGVVALALSYAKKQGKTFTRSQFKNMILASTNDIDTKIGKTTSKSYQKVTITGTSSYYPAKADLKMTPYYHQMGTGAIDAWRLCMNIDGLPTLTATMGEEQWLSLEPAFGSSSVSLTYLSVDVPQTVVDALGLQKLNPKASGKYVPVPEEECYAYVQFGRLYMKPTKCGSGTITIFAVGGGSSVGGGDAAPGGMKISQSVSVMSRPVDGGNGTGGWL